LPKIRGIHNIEVISDLKQKMIDNSISNHDFSGLNSTKKHLWNDPIRYSLSNTKSNPMKYGGN
jgi:hypothetical protein